MFFVVKQSVGGGNVSLQICTVQLEKKTKEIGAGNSKSKM